MNLINTGLDPEMKSTMDEIAAVDDLLLAQKKDELTGEITQIQGEIERAIIRASHANDTATIYALTSPEEANKLHRDLVFMKRKLENKRFELEHLAS